MWVTPYLNYPVDVRIVRLQSQIYIWIKHASISKYLLYLSSSYLR